MTPTAEAASTIAPFAGVLLGFISGVWIPVDQLPDWLVEVGRIFPLAHSPSRCSGRWPTPRSAPA